MSPRRTWLIVAAALILLFPLPSAWAAPPAVGTITPASGASTPDQWVTFTSTYTDPDGWQNLKQVRLLVSPDGSRANAALVMYQRGTNLLHLRSDDNTTWIGGVTPGTATALEDSQGRLDCARTRVTGSGNQLTVQWVISFKAAYSGRAYNTYLWAKDGPSSTTGWIQKGTWTVNRLPIGFLDGADPGHIFGWTVDSDEPTRALDVEILVNGVVRATVRADRRRPDLVSAGVAPNPEHGFDFPTANLNLSSGTYTVTAQAIDPSTTQRQLLTNTKIFTYDPTPPTSPVVTDDGAFTSSTTQLHATWTSSDAESGIAEYQYAIGTTSGGTDVVNWTSTGTTASVTKTGFTLSNGTNYYFSVKARNGAGTFSAVGVSDGIVVDTALISYTVSTASFNWIETTTPTGITDDDQAEDFLLPFPVEFFGVSYSAVRVSSNGFLQFGPCDECTSFRPQAIPNLSAPNRIAAVFWRDLDPSRGGGITYLSEPTQFVVTWSRVPNYSDSNLQTFQAILRSDGSLIFQYSAVTHDRTTVIGLENSDGSLGVAYTALPAANTAIMFTQVAVPDSTPPTVPVVTDDGIYSAQTTRLHATWRSEDPERPIVEYQYQIREDSPTGTVLVDWTSTGTTAEVNRTDLSLTRGKIYFFAVKAKNSAGLWSDIGFSDGITISGTHISENIATDTTWSLSESPYIVAAAVTVLNGATFSIEPGVEVYFNKNTSLIIGSISQSGTIIARGLPTQPILFTSNQTPKAPGFWGGILFGSYSLSSSLLEHCTIKYSGSGIQLSNTRPVIEHNTITANSKGIVVSSASGLERIRHNHITGNTSGGLVNNSEAVVAAPLNWWGNVSGPSGIGPGIGDAVTGNVIFEPWLGAPPTGPFKWTEALDSPDPFSQAGGWTTFFGALSESGNWTVTLKDSTDTVVKSFTGTGTLFAQDWTGDDASASPLPNGTYTYQLDAISGTNAGQPASPGIGRVALDNTLPVANITAPTPNQMFSAGTAVDIFGTASGANFSSYRVEYGAGLLPTSWNSITSKTTPVTNGLLASWNTAGRNSSVYTLRLTVTTTTGKTANELVAVRMLSFSNLTDAPDPFSPNLDGAKDVTVIGVASTFPVNWTLTIKDNTGTAVKTYSGTSQTVSQSQSWDGKNETGVVVPDGIYSYQFQGTHAETGVIATSAIGQVALDNTPPTALITSPTENQTFLTDDPIVFTGTADDTNLWYYTLAYGIGTSPASFTNLITSYGRVVNGTLYTLDIHQLNLPPNTYIFRLTVKDNAGNTSIVSRHVTLDYIQLTNISASPVFIDPYRGEKASINYTTSRSADIAIRIYDDLTKQLVRTFIQSVTQAGAQSVLWDGKNAAGSIAPLEAHFFTIVATDSNGRRGTYNDAVNPLRGPTPGYFATVNATGFDPYRNDLAPVGYDLSALGRLTIRILNSNVISGTPIRTLVDQGIRTQGLHTEYWDGRKDDGTIHAGTFGIRSDPGVSLPQNPIILSRSPIEISNFRSEAYLIQPVFGEVSALTYTLTQNATVSVNLSDPNGNSVRTLLTNASQVAGAQRLEWDGRTDNGRLVSTEGDYTVFLTAVDPVSGLTYKRRGTVVVYK